MVVSIDTQSTNKTVKIIRSNRLTTFRAKGTIDLYQASLSLLGMLLQEKPEQDQDGDVKQADCAVEDVGGVKETDLDQ